MRSGHLRCDLRLSMYPLDLTTDIPKNSSTPSHLPNGSSATTWTSTTQRLHLRRLSCTISASLTPGRCTIGRTPPSRSSSLRGISCLLSQLGIKCRPFSRGRHGLLGLYHFLVALGGCHDRSCARRDSRYRRRQEAFPCRRSGTRSGGFDGARASRHGYVFARIDHFCGWQHGVCRRKHFLWGIAPAGSAAARYGPRLSARLRSGLSWRRVAPDHQCPLDPPAGLVLDA